MIAVTFVCGHTVQVKGEGSPSCYCGQRRVVRVEAPSPTFRGMVRGPHAQYEMLPAIPVGHLMKET